MNREWLLNQGDIMNVKGVAEFLGIGISQVYQRAKTKQIPCVRLGKHIRFSRRSLMEWVDSKRVDK